MLVVDRCMNHLDDQKSYEFPNHDVLLSVEARQRKLFVPVLMEAVHPRAAHGPVATDSSHLGIRHAGSDEDSPPSSSHRCTKRPFRYCAVSGVGRGRLPTRGLNHGVVITASSLPRPRGSRGSRSRPSSQPRRLIAEKLRRQGAGVGLKCTVDPTTLRSTPLLFRGARADHTILSGCLRVVQGAVCARDQVGD
jgi:hypothetical protein